MYLHNLYKSAVTICQRLSQTYCEMPYEEQVSLLFNNYSENETFINFVLNTIHRYIV